MRTKKIIVAGIHRSVRLAERHLAELRREVGKQGEITFAEIIARRNEKGQFSSRGRSFTFEIHVKPKKMSVLILAVSYPWHGKYFSFVGRKFSVSKVRPAGVTKFKHKFILKLREALNVGNKPLWFNPAKMMNTSHETRNYNRLLIGTEEFEDERG